MRSRWDDAEATSFAGPIGECVYCTRLIGSDPSLVLHGGGNSSVKAPVADITGRSVDAIHVKGSGWDMGTIAAAGLAPLHLPRLHDLLALDALSDPDMMRELAAAKLDPGAPNPSVESLLHAFLPHRAVQHRHADVIINLTNLGDGEAVAGHHARHFVAIVLAGGSLVEVEQPRVPAGYLHALVSQARHPAADRVERVERGRIARKLGEEDRRSLDRLHAVSPVVS